MLYFFCEININFKEHLEYNFWKTATLMLLDSEKGRSFERAKVQFSETKVRPMQIRHKI